MSNWTPLDTASFPHFWFLDITLGRTHRPTFPLKMHLKNLGKTIKRHKPSKHVITIVHPKCILSKLMELRHIQMSIYTLWVCLNPIETDSSGFLRHLEPILMGFLNNSGKFRSHLFQNGCFCLF